MLAIKSIIPHGKIVKESAAMRIVSIVRIAQLFVKHVKVDILLKISQIPKIDVVNFQYIYQIA